MEEDTLRRMIRAGQPSRGESIHTSVSDFIRFGGLVFEEGGVSVSLGTQIITKAVLSLVWPAQPGVRRI